MAPRGHRQPEVEILDDAAAAKIGIGEQRPRQGHAGPGQMHPCRQPLETALADEVAQHEGEVGHLDERRGGQVGPQQIDRLHRARSSRCGIDQRGDARSIDPAIGVDHQHH